MYNVAITDDALTPPGSNGTAGSRPPYTIVSVFIPGIGYVYDGRNGSTGAGGVFSNPEGGLLALIPKLGLGENVTIIVTAVPTTDVEVGVPISPKPGVLIDNLPGPYTGPGSSGGGGSGGNAGSGSGSGGNGSGGSSGGGTAVQPSSPLPVVPTKKASVNVSVVTGTDGAGTKTLVPG